MELLRSAPVSPLSPHSLSFLLLHSSSSLTFKSFSVAVTEFSITRAGMKLNRVCAPSALYCTQRTKTVRQERDSSGSIFCRIQEEWAGESDGLLLL